MSGEADHRLREPDASLGDLMGRLTTDVGEMVTAHIDLAKVEIKDEVTKAGKGAGMIGGGAFAGLVAVLMLSMALGWGLAELMAPGWAFLIVGLAWAAAAAALAVMGKNELDDVDPKPNETMQEIEEDKRWLKNDVN